MNKIASIPHLRSGLRQTDNGNKKNVIATLRDTAIATLFPLLGSVSRSISDSVRAAYIAKGVSLDWDLTNYDDASEFAYNVQKLPSITPTQKAAANLLKTCAHVLEADTVTETHIEWVLDAYASLDSYSADVGNKFIRSRQPNTGGPIRKRIAALLKKSPTLKNSELWEAVSKKPPKGWNVVEGREGPWLDGPTSSQQMSKRRFFNVCSEERKKMTS